MSINTKRTLVICMTAAMGLFIEMGCATKKYVKKQVDPVSGRVDELAEVSKRNEAAIKDVDARAQAGIQGVQSKASEVDAKAMAADQKALEAQQMARSAETKISAAESGVNQKISNIDSYKPVENASINFKSNHAEVSDEAKSTLDQLAAKVKGSKGYCWKFRASQTVSEATTTIWGSARSDLRMSFGILSSSTRFHSSACSSWAWEKPDRWRITQPRRVGRRTVALRSPC